MKILHVYAGNLFGGIETLLVTLAKTQSICPGIQHYFALCFEGRLANELRKLNAKVRILGNVRLSRPWTLWQARSQLQKLIQQEQFDVLICHACWSQAAFGSLARRNRLPLVLWCHDVLTGQHPIERLAKFVLPDLVIANSRYTEASVPKLYQTPSETLLIPVVFPEVTHPESLRQAVRAELNTPEQSIVIIQVSRLERWKGHSLLLSALAKLHSIPNWTCWIVGGVQRPGEADYLGELKMQAEALGISQRILFLGQRTDVPRLLAAADIHCQPNTGAEPFGIAFIEALYAGLPVVTTALGGATEIVDDSCGKLVPPNDPDALSEALAILISNHQTRTTLGLGGKVRADYLCNPKNQLNKLFRLLSPLISPKVVP